MTIVQTTAMNLRVGDTLALDSGNYLVRVEHVALRRGFEIEIKYRNGRSPQLHAMTVSKYTKLNLAK